MCLPPCKATVANSNFELVNTSGKADGEPSNLGQQTSNHTMSSSPQPLQRGRRATRAATGVVKSIKSRFDPTAAALSDRAQHNALKEAQQRRSASVGSTRARSSGVGPQRRSKRGMDAATLAILKQAGVDAARTPPKKQQRAASRRTTSASAASPTTSARQRRHNKAAATSRSASPSPSARSARASSSARRKQSHKAAQKQAQQKQRSHRHKQVTNGASSRPASTSASASPRRGRQKRRHSSTAASPQRSALSSLSSPSSSPTTAAAPPRSPPLSPTLAAAQDAAQRRSRVRQAWIGRLEQVDALLQLFGEPEDFVPSILVYGLSASGKTTVVRHVLKTLLLPHT